MTEVHAYNVVDDQDPDILNQGTVIHAKKYFEEKERKKHDIDQSIYTFRLPYEDDMHNSINKSSTFIVLITLLLFMWIIYDFIFGDK